MNENSVGEIIDRFERMEDFSQAIDSDERILGIDSDSLYKIDEDKWPRYKQRQWIIHRMYYQLVNTEPGVKENLESIIRAAFRKMPAAFDEPYSVDQVVDAAVEEGKHLGPPRKPDPWYVRFFDKIGL